MSATQIDVDDNALAEAMRLSGAKTKKEMVNIALREYADRRRRAERRLRHLENAQRWDEAGFQERHAAEKPNDA
ncbi:type II toxin-antitoxin system VapB family antitoxin [Streptomyces sp. NRRL F-5135]|uniref:type II toxin-antitoxin system VapB family antitoxin n=1 Tax=Streptomyces sp. NRRL F-5135 TaxID=1463858 RepID=UPI0004C4F27C|nr:type II toxin-antitoxin system VapB family antitoxin [Streptomyces sp. NRRL F-5135]